MDYELIVTERADELIDASLDYLTNKLMNPEAAVHLLDELSIIYKRLIEKPYQFPESKDAYLRKRNYREALLAGMNYKVVFRVEGTVVYIVGFFNDLEDYPNKVAE